MTPIATVPSPCVDVCKMDAATGRCTGCLRTLDEISAWPRLDDAARRALWLRLHERRAQQDAATVAPTGGVGSGVAP